MTTAESTVLKEIDPEDAALVAEFNLREEQDRDLDGWLPAWFLGKLAGIQGLRDAIKEQQKVLLAQCDSAERALKYRWGKAFYRIVEADVARSPKRSVDYGTGRAGFRKQPAKLIVVDEEAAVAYLEDFHPSALVTKYSVDVKAVKQLLIPDIEKGGGEPDGFTYIAASDAFYPDITPAALPEGTINDEARDDPRNDDGQEGEHGHDGNNPQGRMACDPRT